MGVEGAQGEEYWEGKSKYSMDSDIYLIYIRALVSEWIDLVFQQYTSTEYLFFLMN